MNLETSFTGFLLEHQLKHKRTLNFLILMESIVTAAKQIRQVYRSGALSGAMGEAGEVNVQGEDQMQLDIASHNLVIHYLSGSEQVLQAISEEAEREISLNDDGRYFVYFDPLDGSSNIKHSLPVGFLFGIAKRNLEGPEDFHLRSGEDFIAAGMFLIPSGDFTFALKDAGAWRFLKDETGTYVRPSPIKFPESHRTWELSWNSGNRRTFSQAVQNWVAENETNYSFRYTGALAVDFHRLLHNGGMFMYPAIVNHPNPDSNRPEGKLRLLYECNVAAFIAREAGGSAVDERGEDILSIKPESLHQRSALYVGSNEVIESVRAALQAA